MGHVGIRFGKGQMALPLFVTTEEATMQGGWGAREKFFALVCSIWTQQFSQGCQERPYHNDSTASRLLSEVKHCRAWLVLRWGTTLESQGIPTRWNPRCCSFAFVHSNLLSQLEQGHIEGHSGAIRHRVLTLLKKVEVRAGIWDMLASDLARDRWHCLHLSLLKKLRCRVGGGREKFFCTCTQYMDATIQPGLPGTTIPQ